MKVLLCLVIVVCLPLTLTSETQHRFKVCVQVRGDNDPLTHIITSNLKRELRALGDVDIVGYVDEWQYLMSVAYLVEKSKLEVVTGWLSLAVSWNTRVSDSLFKDEFPAPVVFASFGARNLAVSLWTRDDLHQWCIGQAGGFNDNVLEPARSVLKE